MIYKPRVVGYSRTKTGSIQPLVNPFLEHSIKRLVAGPARHGPRGLR